MASLGEQLRIAVVDGRGVAARLAAGEVLVVLEVERADELLRAPAVTLQIEVVHGMTPFEGPRAGRTVHARLYQRPRSPTPPAAVDGVDDRRARRTARRPGRRRPRRPASRGSRGPRPGVHWLTMPPRPGDTVDLDVTTLAYGGQGVARLDEFVVFVRGAVPGDRVRARITKRKRSHAEARTLETLSPSPRRVAPRCRHSQECGGCEWQTLAYEAQLEFKQQQVVDSLRAPRPPRGLPAGAHPRHGRSLALPQQDGVLVRRRRGRRAGPRAAQARLLEGDRRRRRLRAGVGAHEPRPSGGRRGLQGPQPRAVLARRRRAACCGTWSCARDSPAATCCSTCSSPPGSRRSRSSRRASSPRAAAPRSRSR